jgi:primosomal protein N' (replication factor Y)
MFVCQIVVDIPLRNSFHYLSQDNLSIGQKVIVSFKNKSRVGFVLSCISTADFSEYPLDKLSYIDRVADICNIDAHLMKLAQFVSQYYHHPLATTLFTILPNYYKQIEDRTPDCKSIAFYNVLDNEINLQAIKQLEVLDYIKSNKIVSSDSLTKEFGSSVKVIINKLVDKQIIEQTSLIDKSTQINKLELNDEQQEVFNKLSDSLNTFHPALLYGITGSGKTELFMHLIEQVLKSDKQILVLIPEINLTPQLMNWFSTRFIYANIAILNSEVTNKQRYDIWHSASNAQVDIIIGTRLSVFTPFKNLGLIIVDEEHDDSFKQNDGLRYHARDLAMWRAKELNIPIILASATPSMESLYNYKLGKYHLYKLSQRAVTQATLPQIQIINTQQHQLNYAGLSELVCNKLEENLAKRELSLIFINRRGYAPVITCYDCGWVSQCKNCSANMVYHHDKHYLKCHHCGLQTSVPTKCPTCANQYLHTIGHGTQKLEEFLHLRFPDANIVRVDRDTTSSKQAWSELYEQINNGKVDIIVGTQMLAKGHNFANLTLVVGLNLDNALFSYDFRASEDMFQILTQVSGRAGRSEKSGTVLLQTNYPEHPIYKFISQHDINGFINYTLAERKTNNLPPYAFMAIVKLSSTSEPKLQRGLKELSKLAKSIPHKEIEIFAAVQAVMYKIHNRFRGQMLISSNDRGGLHEYLACLEQQFNQLSYVTVALDVDPFEV